MRFTRARSSFVGRADYSRVRGRYAAAALRPPLARLLAPLVWRCFRVSSEESRPVGGWAACPPPLRASFYPWRPRAARSFTATPRGGLLPRRPMLRAAFRCGRPIAAGGLTLRAAYRCGRPFAAGGLSPARPFARPPSRPLALTPARAYARPPFRPPALSAAAGAAAPCLARSVGFGGRLPLAAFPLAALAGVAAALTRQGFVRGWREAAVAGPALVGLCCDAPRSLRRGPVLRGSQPDPRTPSPCVLLWSPFWGRAARAARVSRLHGGIVLSRPVGRPPPCCALELR